MSSIIAFEVLLIVALILMNGMLAMSEIALVSSGKGRLGEMAKRGDSGAAVALRLLERPTRFLSAIQIGITLIGVFAGAFGGATIAEFIAESLQAFPSLARYADGIGLGIVVLVITYLSLVFGEIVPKRIALNRPEAVSSFVARPIDLLAKVTFPALALLTVSTDAALSFLRVRASRAPQITRTDIRLLLEQAAQEGVFAQEELAMAERVLELGRRTVGELMTPRPRIAWLDAADPPEENARRVAQSPHTYLVLCDGAIDRVIGIVSAKDLWAQHLAAQHMDLRAAAIPPVYVPEQLSVFDLLKHFSQSEQRIAIVVDEHGSLQGVITPTDVFKEIAGVTVGQLTHVARPVQREDGSWLLDGLMPFHEFLAFFGLEEPAPEEHRSYQTLGGFVMHRLDRVPLPGDTLEWHGIRLEVLDMDGRRVDKVLAHKLQ